MDYFPPYSPDFLNHSLEIINDFKDKYDEDSKGAVFEEVLNELKSLHKTLKKIMSRQGRSITYIDADMFEVDELDYEDFDFELFFPDGSKTVGFGLTHDVTFLNPSITHILIDNEVYELSQHDNINSDMKKMLKYAFNNGNTSTVESNELYDFDYILMYRDGIVMPIREHVYVVDESNWQNVCRLIYQMIKDITRV